MDDNCCMFLQSINLIDSIQRPHGTFRNWNYTRSVNTAQLISWTYLFGNTFQPWGQNSKLHSPETDGRRLSPSQCGLSNRPMGIVQSLVQEGASAVCLVQPGLDRGLVLIHITEASIPWAAWTTGATMNNWCKSDWMETTLMRFFLHGLYCRFYWYLWGWRRCETPQYVMAACFHLASQLLFGSSLMVHLSCISHTKEFGKAKRMDPFIIIEHLQMKAKKPQNTHT